MMLCACMAPKALFLVSAYRMKALFTSSAASSSSGRAEQPAITSLPAGSNAEQPARNAVQLANALRSIADVDSWLKSNAVALGSSAEVMRIKEVVDCLSTKPKPRQEAVEQFFKPWSVQQFIKKSRRPLSELIKELSDKVVKAAARLQANLYSAAGSAAQPASSSAEQPALAGSSTDRADVQDDPAAGEDHVLANLKER